MSRIGIIGWAQTEHKRRRDDVHRGELVYHTTKDVLKNTGLEIGDIDAVISASCDAIDGISISNAFVSEAYGAFMKEESKVEEDGAYAAMYAYYRLLTGTWKNTMIVAHGKISDSSPAFYTNMMCDPFLLRPLGLTGLSASALQANTYFTKYGVKEEDAAQVVVKNRRNGLLNKNAQVKGNLTVSDVMASPYLAKPIKKQDASPISDGAAAIILATEDFIKAGGYDAVWIEGIGFYQDAYYPGYKDLSTSPSCKLAAQKAYSEAGIKNPLSEIDFAEIYEPFSFYELMLYELLGLCKEGEGKKLIQDGITNIDGKFPVNASGGTLCANPIMVAGLVRMIEACMQLKNKAGEHQIKKSLKKGLVHATSGLFLQSNIVYVLGN